MKEGVNCYGRRTYKMVNTKGPWEKKGTSFRDANGEEHKEGVRYMTRHVTQNDMSRKRKSRTAQRGGIGTGLLQGPGYGGE